MNNKIKNELAEYFEPPEALRKEEFLNSPDMHLLQNTASGKDVTYRGFVLTQIMYIRKWVWIAAAIFFAYVLFSAKHFNMDLLRILSSFTPVLALAVITESGRSENYGMAELEISARFSLRYVILARLLILGIANLITFCLFILLIYKNTDTGILVSALCVSCPYLLTSFLGLFITRKINGRKSAYMCIGIAALVSIGNVAAYDILPHIFEAAYATWWAFAIIILALGYANELYKKIQMSEELA